MNLIESIRNLLFGEDTEQEPSGFEQLKEALRTPPQSVELEAAYGLPTIDTQASNTAVFPVDVFDQNDEYYTEISLEFDIPSDGLEGADDLQEFLAAKDIDGVGQLHLISGEEAEISYVNGNLGVDW